MSGILPVEVPPQLPPASAVPAGPAHTTPTRAPATRRRAPLPRIGAATEADLLGVRDGHRVDMATFSIYPQVTSRTTKRISLDAAQSPLTRTSRRCYQPCNFRPLDAPSWVGLKTQSRRAGRDGHPGCRAVLYVGSSIHRSSGRSA